MNIDGGRDYIRNLVVRQLESLYLWDKKDEDILEKHLDATLNRVEHCFVHSNLKHNTKDGIAEFSPFHQGQYAAFLFFLANTIYKKETGSTLPKYLSSLNKSINHIDLHHTVNMPDVFFAEHPLGTICSKAEYGDFFFVLHGCTVGTANSIEPLIYPRIGNHVTMLGNSAILGNCTIGNHVTLAFGTVIKNMDIEDDCIVFGQSPHLVIQKRSREDSIKYASDLWRLFDKGEQSEVF